MIAISNQQRDDIIRYLDLLCEAYKPQSNSNTRSYNICRRAGILRKQLIKKEPFSSSDSSERLKNLVFQSDYFLIVYNFAVT